MIGYIKGTLMHAEEAEATVLVNGIGYQVTLGNEAVEKLTGNLGEEVELWVHTHVREDQLALFGFHSPMQKKLFLILTGVSGVGPKLAITVVTKLDTSELVDAITMGNTKVLVSIPGIGKKMADRIVLELKEKVLGKAVELKAGGSAGTGNDATWRDLAEALSGLGFPDNKIMAVIRLIRQDSGAETMILDDALKIALQKINQC